MILAGIDDIGRP